MDPVMLTLEAGVMLMATIVQMMGSKKAAQDALDMVEAQAANTVADTAESAKFGPDPFPKSQ